MLAPEPDLVTESGHHVWDEWAIEHETGLFLHALVRATKPRVVVEHGTGRGVAAEFLARALTENGQGGRLITFEPDDGYRAQAAERLAPLNVELQPGMGVPFHGDPDMVFVDCYGPHREPVIRHWLAEHPGNPLVVIHDAKRSYPFHLGTGVFLPGHDGLWVGRPGRQVATSSRAHSVHT